MTVYVGHFGLLTRLVLVAACASLFGGETEKKGPTSVQPFAILRVAEDGTTELRALPKQMRQASPATQVTPRETRRSTGSLPDLRVTEFEADCLNGLLAIEGIVHNQGTVAAAPFFMGVYASADPSITIDDNLVAQLPFSDPLEAGGDAEFLAELNAANVPLGTWYVGVFVDHEGDVIEANEQNNTAVDGQQGLPCPRDAPDLTVTSVEGLCQIGGTLDLVISVSNIGNLPASRFEVGVYVSADPEIKTNDIRVFSFENSGGLAAGSDRTYVRSLFETSSPPGTWYIGVIADDLNQVSEFNETNNNLAGNQETLPCSVTTPDLFLGSIVGVCTGPGILQVNGRVENGGPGYAGPFEVAIYLSTNSAITFLDTRLGSISYPHLVSGENAFFEEVYNVTGLLDPGDYWVGAIADDTHTVTEHDEDNNDRAGNIIELPCLQADVDLRVTSLSALCMSNNSMRFNGVVTNTGSESTLPFSLGYYLSPDANITPTDMRIGSEIIAPGLGGSSSRVYDRTFDLSAIPPGTWYAGVYTDDQFNILELNENNNGNSDGPFSLPCGPQIVVIPRQLNFDFTALSLGQTSSRPFSIFNEGANQLSGTISQLGLSPWIIDINPTSFSLDTGQLQVVDVTVDSGLAPPGFSDDILRIISNAVNEDPIDIDISLRNPNLAQITVGDNAGLVGDTLSVPINVDDLAGTPVTSYQFSLSYDASLLAFSGLDLAGTLSQTWVVDANEPTPGNLVVAGIDALPLAGDGLLLNLTFTLLAGSGGECSDLTPSNFIFNNGNPAAQTSSGEVCVASCTLGDLDADGNITAFDASLCLSRALGIPTAFDPIPVGCADADCDGIVTAFDAALILRVVLELEPGFCLDNPLPLGDAVDVTLPRLINPASAAFDLPVFVSAVDAGTDVIAWQFTLSFDPNLFVVVGAENAGTLSAGQTVAANTAVAGQVTVGGFGANPMTGDGTLVRLQVQGLDPGIETPAWDAFLFNTGAPVALTQSEELVFMPAAYYQMLIDWPDDPVTALVALINNPAGQ